MLESRDPFPAVTTFSSPSDPAAPGGPRIDDPEVTTTTPWTFQAPGFKLASSWLTARLHRLAP